MRGRQGDPNAEPEALRQAAAAWFAKLRGPGGEALRADFEAWRGADPAHAATFARLERVWAGAAVLERAKGVERTRGARLGPPRPARSAAAWSAAGLCAAALVLIAVVASPSWLKNETASLFWPRLTTRVAEIRAVRLDDGSGVILDTDTVLATRFTPRLRQVRLLRGRARFAVADEARPFVVDVGRGDVETRAAVFDVSAPGGRAIAVTALRGRIEAAGGSQERTSLAQGQRLLVDGGAARLAPADGGLAWPQGRLDFHATPLAAVVAEANRYSAQTISLADPSIGALQVSGVFKAGANADLAAGLAVMFGLQVSRDRAGGLTLSRAP
jgi:transmembrane sensor